MHLISTGKTTVLSDFADLETKSTYQHANGDTTDFQFYQDQRMFVEVNKKSGFEILRIKEKQYEILEIQRVRKLNFDNVYCVACAKQSLEELALGLSNGQVQLYNYKKSTFVHRFNADSTRNSVLHLDYNVTDEYMAGVFENGQINIYGIKTKAKIETINIDGNTTLARFHPTKRFQLCIASFKGGVNIYDVQAKRKVFNSVNAHEAPCRDLCVSAATPDTMISVGYDCIINIYDTRRKTQPLQLTYCHPLSTVAVSDCGTFFSVGNLKGELITYDMRNTKVCLASKKVHEGAVTRVAFVPNDRTAASSSIATTISSSGNQTLDASNSSNNQSTGLSSNVTLRKSFAGSLLPSASEGTLSTHKQRDSFCDFLDFQANKGLEKMSTRFITRRDSFDWDTLERQTSNEGNRKSFLQIASNLNASSSPISKNNAGADDGKLNGSDEFVNTKPRRKAAAEMPAMPLRDRSNTPKITQRYSNMLIQIEEEQVQNNSSSSDKENPHPELELVSGIQILSGDRNSTPQQKRHSLESYIPPTAHNSALKNKAQAKNASANFDMHKAIDDLRTEMNERFRQLEFELKFTAETNKWQMFTQASNLFNRQSDSTDEIRDALGILLQTDPFVNEFLKLQQENAILKAQLQQLLNKN